MPRNLDTLPVGARFIIPGTGQKGKILHVGPGSVLVAFDARKRTTFKTNGGERVSFDKAETARIAPATRVKRLVKRKGRKQRWDDPYGFALCVRSWAMRAVDRWHDTQEGAQ